MFELAMGIIGLGIDSFRMTLVGDTKEFITGFGTGLNVSIGDTLVESMGRSLAAEHPSAKACSCDVLTVGMAGAMSAVLVVDVLHVAVTSDMHVFTDGRIGIIGTGGTVIVGWGLMTGP